MKPQPVGEVVVLLCQSHDGIQTRVVLSLPGKRLGHGGWNELTADTAHARGGTGVHTQLIRSSLWGRREGQALETNRKATQPCLSALAPPPPT